MRDDWEGKLETGLDETVGLSMELLVWKGGSSHKRGKVCRYEGWSSTRERLLIPFSGMSAEAADVAWSSAEVAS